MYCGELKPEFFYVLKVKTQKSFNSQRVKLKEQLTALIKAFPAVHRLLSSRGFVPWYSHFKKAFIVANYTNMPSNSCYGFIHYLVKIQPWLSIYATINVFCFICRHKQCTLSIIKEILQCVSVLINEQWYKEENNYLIAFTNSTYNFVTVSFWTLFSQLVHSIYTLHFLCVLDLDDDNVVF